MESVYTGKPWERITLKTSILPETWEGIKKFRKRRDLGDQSDCSGGGWSAISLKVRAGNWLKKHESPGYYINVREKLIKIT
jgi:hypothetical protein